MVPRLPLVAAVALTLLAGCADQGAGPGADDGSLAWLLPRQGELPAGWQLKEIDARPEWLAEGEDNPGTASGAAVGMAQVVSGNDAVPEETLLGVYERASGPAQHVAVIALRFPVDQQPQQWRALKGWAAEQADGEAGEQEEDSAGEDDFSLFFSTCGLRPYYGLVRGTDVVLVLGSDDAEEVPHDLVYRAALQLTQTLVERTGGQHVCTVDEQRQAAEMHGPWA